MPQLKFQDIFSLIDIAKKEDISLKNIKTIDFSNKQFLCSFSHYIFALSFQLNSKEYENLIQFFILSLSDCLKKPTDKSNIVAFSYAVARLGYEEENGEEKINQSKLEQDFNKVSTIMAATFLSKINVLYDYVATFSSSIRVESNKTLIQISTEILKSHRENKKPDVFNQFFKMIPDLGSSLNSAYSSLDSVYSSLTAKEPSVNDIIGSQTAQAHYLSLLNNKNPTKEACDFFCLLLKDWCKLKDQSQSIKTKLDQTLHFIKSEIKESPQLLIYTDDLFNKHIPQLIFYIEAMKHQGNFDEQVKSVETYIDKINNNYLEHFDFKMKVYQKFLQEKLSNF